MPLSERTGKALLLSLFYNLSSGSPELNNVLQRIVPALVAPFTSASSMSSQQVAQEFYDSFYLRDALPLATSPDFWTDPRTTIAALKFSMDGRTERAAEMLSVPCLSQEAVAWFVRTHLKVDPFTILSKTLLDEAWGALEMYFPAQVGGGPSAAAAASSACSAEPANK